jgi:hypothetical protein
MRCFSIILAAILLPGCATTPTPTAEVKPVTGSQILAPNYFQRSDANQVEVLIKRDRGFSGGGTGIVFHIDGKPVAKLGAGEGATIYLPPGHYLFGVLPTVNFLGAHSLLETEANVSAGTPQHYRIYTSSGGDMSFHIARTSN